MLQLLPMRSSRAGTIRRSRRRVSMRLEWCWAAWLYSPQWWRDELWKTNAKPGTTFDDVVNRFRTRFIPGADANNLILQMRTWEKHDVGTTKGFGGDEKKALGSIKVPFLYMPSMTDQYFPVGDARYESQFMHTVTLLPIPSLWGHPAGAAADPADAKFLNENIAKFLAGCAGGWGEDCSCKLRRQFNGAEAAEARRLRCVRCLWHRRAAWPVLG